jgi:uncharacterized RDD family membrane protein YckC
MKTFRIRMAALGLGLAVAACATLAIAPLAAQETTPVKPAQTAKPPKPTPPLLPPVEQRGMPPTTVHPRQNRPVAPSDLRALTYDTLEEQVTETYYFTHPIVRVGQDYTLKVGETVRQLQSVLADVRVDGHVERDVVVSLGNVTLSSTAVVDGSLVVIGGSATIEPGAAVRRDFVVVGGTASTPPDFSPQGQHVVIGTPAIGGWLKNLVPWLTRGLLWGRVIVPDLAWVWGVVAIAFFIGLVMNHLFNRQVGSSAEVLGRRPISAFFMGLLVLLLSGPILAIIAASIVGLAVVPFAIAALIVAGLMGRIAVARAIGASVMSVDDPDSRFQSARSFVLGSGLITVAYMIPVLGLLTWALVGVFGLGAATMSFAGTLRRERPVPPPKVPVEPPPLVTPPAGDSPFPSASAPAFTSPIAMGADNMINEGAPPQPAPEAGGIPRPPRMPDAGDLSFYPRASFLDRIAAFALDVVLLAIANAFLNHFPGHRDEGWFMFLVLAYMIGFTAWKGTTLGGIVCNLRVVRTNGGDLRFIDAVVRGLSSIFSIAALGIGCLWMLNDAERQMWHDKIAGTIVVKVPRELVLA